MKSMLIFPYKLMYLSGDDYHNHCADDRGCYYGQKLCLNDIEVKHQCHTRRDKEKAEIFHKEVGYAFHSPQIYPLQLQACCQKQHPDDARRQFDAGEPHYQLSYGEKAENNTTLNYHFFLFKINLFHNLSPLLSRNRLSFFIVSAHYLLPTITLQTVSPVFTK